MGRITDFIDYINQDYEPNSLVKKSEYNNISFTDKIVTLSKKYRRQRKKEKRNEKNK